MVFRAATENWFDEEVVVLQGPVGERATIHPGMGANLIELALPPAPGEEAVPVIAGPADAGALAKAPTRYGAPVLFPFPSRIAGGRFSYQGRSYQLDVYPEDGNARHGFVVKRPFSVDRQGADSSGSWVTLSLDGDIPDIQRQFPFPFRLALTFRLDALGLHVEAVGSNTGHTTMPMGFGWHPYFRMPLAAGGDRNRCRLQVPARQYWELDAKLIPTGRRLPVGGKLDLLEGQPVAENSYDDIFTAVVRDAEGWSYAALYDDAAGLRVTMGAGPSFREWVIYTPPGRPAICLEPYTCAGNAFNLQSAGIDAGVADIAPGEAWHDAMVIRLDLGI